MVNESMMLLRKGVPMTLPSGLEVRVRPIDTGLLLSLELPPVLMQVLEESLLGISEGKTTEESVSDQVSQAVTDFRRGVNIYKSGRIYGGIIAGHCFVDPKVVEKDPKDEHEITIAEMQTEDLLALAQIVNVPLAELSTFRFGQGENVESVAAGESGVPDTESGAESDGVGGAPDGINAQPVVDDVSV